jgi:hypothetical protein
MCARRACHPGVHVARPRRDASRICLAARAALLALRGVAPERLNHRASWRCCQRTRALTYDPVRIRPGVTVVTRMPSRFNSARKVSDSPTSANLPAAYAPR